jgi:hypothetical protein
MLYDSRKLVAQSSVHAANQIEKLSYVCAGCYLYALHFSMKELAALENRDQELFHCLASTFPSLFMITTGLVRPTS